MKTLKQTENLLRSWTPRGPSRRLELDLFGRAGAQARPIVKAGWLGPLAALGLTCLVGLFNQSLTLSSSFRGLAAPTAAMITNPALISSLNLASSQSSQNSYRGTFEWTNLSHSLTTAAPYRPAGGRVQ